MKVSRTALGAGLIAVLCLSWTAESRFGTSARSDLQRHRTSQLTGMKVEGLDGVELGRVNDFLVDMQVGEVKYALVGSRSRLGLRSARRAVPAQAISMGTAKRDTLAVQMTQPRWNRAPTFKKGHLAQLNRPERYRQLASIYPLQSAGVKRQETPATSRPDLAPIGQDKGYAPREPSVASGLHLVSDIVGKDVVNRQNENVGEVTDLLLDFTGQRPAFAIISAGRLLKREVTFAVPLPSLSLTGGDKVLVDANRIIFEQAPSFELSEWFSRSATTPGAVYKYDDSEGEGRKTQRVTQAKQPNLKADRLMSKRVREAITNHTELSMAARNVAVNTVAGQVTLSGAVHNAQEKDQLLRTARQVAGAQNVQDELQIKPK
jgi:sporulation protein YlmC with PRC-barrel domain